MVAARLIEPTSKARVPCVLRDLGGGAQIHALAPRAPPPVLGDPGGGKWTCGPCSGPWGVVSSGATGRRTSQVLFEHVSATGGLVLFLQA